VIVIGVVVGDVDAVGDLVVIEKTSTWALGGPRALRPRPRPRLFEHDAVADHVHDHDADDDHGRPSRN